MGASVTFLSPARSFPRDHGSRNGMIQYRSSAVNDLVYGPVVDWKEPSYGRAVAIFVVGSLCLVLALVVEARLLFAFGVIPLFMKTEVSG